MAGAPRVAYGYGQPAVAPARVPSAGSSRHEGIRVSQSDPLPLCDEPNHQTGWARTPLLDALHRPDVQRLFVHDNAAVGVPGLRALHGASDIRFAERAVLLARPGDVVVVERNLEPAYQTYLDELGIGPGRNGVLALTEAAPEDVQPAATTLSGLLQRPTALDRVAARCRADRDLRLSTYYPDSTIYQLADDLTARLGRPVTVEGGRAAAVDMANRKDLMRAEAYRLGVPWPPGEVVAVVNQEDCYDRTSVALHDAAQRAVGLTGRVIVRGAWSAHGVDAITLEDACDALRMTDWLADRPGQQHYLVESMLDVSASPNVQVWIDDDGSATVLGVTRQRLSGGLVYGGSLFPHQSPGSAAMAESARVMARRLAEHGYRGLLGFDFIESGPPDETTHHLVEVNGRINGATYALGLAEGINRARSAAGQPAFDCWRSLSPQHCRARTFAELAGQIPDLLYRPGRDAGVIPFNVGCLPHGYTYLLTLAGCQQSAEQLERHVAQRIH